MNEYKYLKTVNSFYYIMAFYDLFGFIASFFLIYNLLKLENCVVIITVVYGIFSLISLSLFALINYLNKYKYNFEDKELHRGVIPGINNSTALICINFFYNSFIFFGFLYFGILNIIELDIWLMAIILFGTLIGFTIILLYFVKRVLKL